jgi:16S rRNA (cytosine967-C5)-methyltransferase
MRGSARRSKAGRRNVRAIAARCVADIVAGRDSLAACYARWARDRDEHSALLRALVTDCIRWHYRLQWQLGQLLDKPLDAREGALSALLRIGLLQLQFMRIPDHAAVDETVGAAKFLGRQHARGLINAVLRRYLRERSALEVAIVADEQAYLNHPSWLIDRIRADWPQAADSILTADNARPPMWLRVNTRRMEPAAYGRKLAAADIDFVLDDELPAAIRLETAMPTAEIPGFDAGEVSVQDRNAQLAAGMLDLGAGQRVLDACAAPGGKTAAIVEARADLDALVALDRSPARIATLEQNLTRLGHRAIVVCADAGEPGQWWDGRVFDRILLDAPCSATGVIRRHPDIRLRRTPEAILGALETQQRLLAALWPLLADGGRLVYVTCSVLRQENALQIDRFLSARPDAELSASKQLLPGEADGDGFYYACVKKRG